MSDLERLHDRLAVLCDSALSKDKFDRVSIIVWRSDNLKSSCIVGNQVDTDDLRNVLAAIDENPNSDVG